MASTTATTSSRQPKVKGDFLASVPGEPPLLIQVGADLLDPKTYDREVRALAAASAEHRMARALLLTLESTPPRPSLPSPLEWRWAGDWLLSKDEV